MDGCEDESVSKQKTGPGQFLVVINSISVSVVINSISVSVVIDSISVSVVLVGPLRLRSIQCLKSTFMDSMNTSPEYQQFFVSKTGAPPHARS